METHPGFGSELRISPTPVIILLACLALTLGLWFDSGSYLSLQAEILAILCLTFCVVGWLLTLWRDTAGRWFTVFALVALIHLAGRGPGIPGLPTLMTIPTAVAAALIGLRAAAATAAGASALLIWSGSTANDGTWGIALVEVWAIFIVMCAVYDRVNRLGSSLWDHFQGAQCRLIEEQERKVELAQALDDLAHTSRQLALTNEKMASLRAIAEEALKTKAAFVSKVSHEFRTPLNMIIGLIDLLIETPEIYGDALPPALFEDLKIVHRNSEHLSNMIDDVLALSQIEAGHLVLHRERVDLTETMLGAIKMVRPLLEKKGLELYVAIPNNLPTIYCDQARVRQVILNLLSNAARYTEKGAITLQAEEESQHIIIRVVDTGPGISREDAERIFEPFSQIDSKLWRDQGGSGLGLSICRQFVNLHGGRIWLDSERGAGSTFSFSLPIAPPLPHITRPGHWINEDWIWHERSSRPKTTELATQARIVVCDETGELYFLLSHLNDEIEFVDIRDVDRLIEDLEQCPAHAVLLNTALPDSLWPKVDRIRQVAPDTPIIGCCVPGQLRGALDCGAVDYLVKPVTRADLEKAIQALSRPVKRVLAVDDDPDVVQLWTRTLHAYDSTLEIFPAFEGEQALAALRNTQPDLMLLDLVMPGLDGWQVLERKRCDEAIRDIPVVIISAQDPAGQPSSSNLLLATMGEGLSLGKLLSGSLKLSELLLKPDSELDPALV